MPNDTKGGWREAIGYMLTHEFSIAQVESFIASEIRSAVESVKPNLNNNMEDKFRCDNCVDYSSGWNDAIEGFESAKEDILKKLGV